MKVFISWSGDQSLEMARALHGWLPQVIQSTKVFFSPKSIGAGARWQDKLSNALNDYDFGIACLTKESIAAPYVQFETGALAKKLVQSRVIPILCGVTQADLVDNPLAQFQNVEFNKEGTWSVLEEINRSLGENKLDAVLLEGAFKTWWPQLGPRLDAIRKADDRPEKKKTEMEASIDAILSIVTSLARSDSERKEREELQEVIRNALVHGRVHVPGSPTPHIYPDTGEPSLSSLMHSAREWDSLQKQLFGPVSTAGGDTGKKKDPK